MAAFSVAGAGSLGHRWCRLVHLSEAQGPHRDLLPATPIPLTGRTARMGYVLLSAICQRGLHIALCPAYSTGSLDHHRETKDLSLERKSGISEAIEVADAAAAAQLVGWQTSVATRRRDRCRTIDRGHYWAVR